MIPSLYVRKLCLRKGLQISLRVKFPSAQKGSKEGKEGRKEEGGGRAKEKQCRRQKGAGSHQGPAGQRLPTGGGLCFDCCRLFDLHQRCSALKGGLTGNLLRLLLRLFSLRFHSDFSLDRADVAGGGGPDLSRGSFDWSGRRGGCWSGGAGQMGKGLGWEPGQQRERRGNVRTGSPEPTFIHISTLL